MNKNNKPLISIIVPVYNIQEYIERCIQSLINQTYKNIEIILINDGSVDNSLNICNSYVKKDQRIKVFSKINGGLSSARNFGLLKANGVYVSFVDGDDWIEQETVETMYNRCSIDNTKISFCGRFDVNSENMNKQIGLCHKKDEVISNEECLRRILLWNNADFSAVDKLYMKELWKDISFPENKICEDIATIYKVILKSDTISIISKPLYNYLHRPNSITTTVKFSKHKFDFEEISKSVLKDVLEQKPTLYNELIIFRLCAINYSLVTLSKQNFMTILSNIKYYNSFHKFVNSTKSIWNKYTTMPNGINNILKYYSMHILYLYTIVTKNKYLFKLASKFKS